MLGRSTSPGEFESAAMPHLNDIFRTAVNLLRDRTEAEDLTQEVYYQAWKSFHRFEPGTNCRAWLFRILFNRMHHQRRKWFQLRTVKEPEIFEETLAYEPPVPDTIRDADILAALRDIPPDYREVVLLADVEEFAYKEIASLLDIPVGTVMSRLSRGRKALRQRLGAVAGEFGLKVRAEGQGQ